MNSQFEQPENAKGTEKSSSFQRWIPRVLWAIAIASMVYMTVLLTTRAPIAISAAFDPNQDYGMPKEQEPVVVEEQPTEVASISLPPLQLAAADATNEITRDLESETIKPDRSREEVQVYTVQSGDAIFSIAGRYDLEPESVLWANYDTLGDDVHMITPGMRLYIPPVDGILYQWEEGDTLEKVADQYYVDPMDIVSWPGNKLDITDPQIAVGQYVMIPGGYRELTTWVVPTIWAANSGANESVTTGCVIPDGGAVGSGGFVWPANNHFLSGNDYWSGHLGIDIAANTGDPIYAADSGVVVYAAGIGGGYGNMVMIDHQNGYHTLYAHLSSINVYCGQSVVQGQLIAGAGSTGNSTGPHLHFEVRLNGGFINPWYVLP